MGEIVDLASARGQKHSRTRPDASAFGPAQIVLYTGIRYERHDADLNGSSGPSPQLS